MTLTDLEKFYQLGNIEGLAFVDNDGVLIEDQTVVSSDAAQVVANAFAEIHRGLRESQRPCKGFLARFSRHQFLSVEVPDGIVILQLNPGQLVNQCFQQVVSMARHSQANQGQSSAPLGGGDALGANPATDGGGAAGATSQITEISPGASSAPAPAAGDSAAWDQFQSGLLKALTRVAPSNLAKKMITDTLPKIGLSGDQIPAKAQFVTIGTLAISAIPNRKRRTLVEKELDILNKNLGL